MEIIRPDTRFNFIGKKKFTIWVSAIAILLSLGSIIYHGGLRLGVDFAGGILLQIKFSKPLDISEVRNAVEAMGSKDAMVQKFGGENEFLIRIEKSSEDLEAMSRQIQTSLQQRFKGQPLEIRRAEVVGPKVGKDLKERLRRVAQSFPQELHHLTCR